jgi:hypothetical protein
MYTDDIESIHMRAEKPREEERTRMTVERIQLEEVKGTSAEMSDVVKKARILNIMRILWEKEKGVITNSKRCSVQQLCCNL